MVYGFIKQVRGPYQGRQHPWTAGTTFKIHLPRTAELPRPTLAAQQPAMRAATNGILVVEDEPACAANHRPAAEKPGYEVQRGLRRRGGVAAFEPPPTLSSSPDRRRMPRMNGKSLGRRSCGAWPNTRIAFMSGYAETLSSITASATRRRAAEQAFRKDGSAQIAFDARQLLVRGRCR